MDMWIVICITFSIHTNHNTNNYKHLKRDLLCFVKELISILLDYLVVVVDDTGSYGKVNSTSDHIISTALFQFSWDNYKGKKSEY